MKRAFDFILALSGIMLGFPFFLFMVFLVLVFDGWPVFYFQERVGLGGRIFKSVQFRTMVPESEKNIGPLQAREGDLRITFLGRILRGTSMDAFPQLWNIFKGEMSFVGPRALREVEIECSDDKPRSIWEFEGAKERCMVRPGLTGVAQILAKRDIPRDRKFKYDIWYIKNRSFLLDLYLIFMSFMVSFCGAWESRGEKLNFFGIREFREKVENQLR